MRKRLSVLLICGLVALVIAGLLGLAAQRPTVAQEPNPTPPPPTWTPGSPGATKTPLPTPTPVGGSASPRAANARIVVRVHFPVAWPWHVVGWQEVCTVVQWKDALGGWHAVEGWRGTLDQVSASADGGIAGLKTWWVADEDLGTGPFRWVAYRCEVGHQLAASEAFHLPDSNGMAEVVDLTLASN